MVTGCALGTDIYVTVVLKKGNMVQGKQDGPLNKAEVLRSTQLRFICRFGAHVGAVRNSQMIQNGKKIRMQTWLTCWSLHDNPTMASRSSTAAAICFGEDREAFTSRNVCKARRASATPSTR